MVEVIDLTKDEPPPPRGVKRERSPSPASEDGRAERVSRAKDLLQANVVASGLPMTPDVIGTQPHVVATTDMMPAGLATSYSAFEAQLSLTASTSSNPSYANVDLGGLPTTPNALEMRPYVATAIMMPSQQQQYPPPSPYAFSSTPYATTAVRSPADHFGKSTVLDGPEIRSYDPSALQTPAESYGWTTPLNTSERQLYAPNTTQGFAQPHGLPYYSTPPANEVATDTITPLPHSKRMKKSTKKAKEAKDEDEDDGEPEIRVRAELNKGIAPSHPTVVPALDGNGAVELRCDFCGANSYPRSGHGSKKPGKGYFQGIRTFHGHFAQCHREQKSDNEIYSMVNIVERCTVHRISQEVVDAVKAGDVNAYSVKERKGAGRDGKGAVHILPQPWKRIPAKYGPHPYGRSAKDDSEAGMYRHRLVLVEEAPVSEDGSAIDPTLTAEDIGHIVDGRTISGHLSRRPAST